MLETCTVCSSTIFPYATREHMMKTWFFDKKKLSHFLEQAQREGS